MRAAGARGPVVELGCRVRYEGGVWTVAAMSAGQVRLLDEDGVVMAMLMSVLFADPDFEVLGAPTAPAVPPVGLLESLPAAVRERALEWERHVREVETGFPGGAEAGGVPRPAYDPAVQNLGRREEAKAAELTATGMRASAVTVRRMRARYRKEGLWGLVDQRAVRPHRAVGRADERVVAALQEVLEAQRERSSGTLERLRLYTERRLEQKHGAGVVPLPSQSAFNRLVHALADGKGLLGTARQRQWRSARPAPPFVPTVVMAPGEVVMLDSTRLDVFAVLDDGVVERAELTIALDVATRSICAAVLQPAGTRSVDAAVLLAQMMVPMPMRPGWPDALSMERSVVPYERLVGVDTACRMLRLPSIRKEFSDIAERALMEQMSYRGFLAELLMAECDDRGRRRSETADQGGELPSGEVPSGVRLDANPNVDAATVHTLASCEWIKNGQPLCLIGDSGTGKSHMLIALGTEAAMKGYRVRYTLATKLVNELVEAADEKQLNKTIARYGRVDLLCIDELGYMELDRRGAELLFQVLTEREEKNSVAIASNESFGGWTKTFTDPRLRAAIVDRLTFNGTIIETGTDSYRLASTRARAEEPAKAG